MGARYAVYTNVGIDFLAGKLPSVSVAWLEELSDTRQLALSVVVRMELLSWPGPPPAMTTLIEFIAARTELPLDEPVVQQPILLR